MTDRGDANGGFMADSTIHGGVQTDTQAQFLFRNNNVTDGYEGSAKSMNMVYVGNVDAPK